MQSAEALLESRQATAAAALNNAKEHVVSQAATPEIPHPAPLQPDPDSTELLGSVTIGDEPCFLTSEDKSMRDQPMVPPEPGPLWWEGRWPKEGVNSLAALERYVDSRLNDIISIGWSGSEFLRKLNVLLGHQAAKNAVRWLNRHNATDPCPPMPKTDDFKYPTEIESVLEGILRHIRKLSVNASRSVNEAALSVTNGQANAQQPEPEKKPVAGEQLNGLSRCHHMAYGLYELAVKTANEATNRNLKTDQEAYDWLKEHRNYLEEVDLPSFNTFSRYLREYRKAYGINKHSPRYGRECGRNIVRQELSVAATDDEAQEHQDLLDRDL
jgi:hypothetical protein